MLYSHAPLARTEGRPLAGPFEHRAIPGSGGTLWEQRQLARAVRDDAPDVFFAPGYTAPLRIRVPTVVTVHDVSFAAHPEWFSFWEGARRRWLTRRSAERAAAVVTVSEFSAEEIAAHLGIPRARIHVVPSGVTVLPPPAGVAREPLILFVGSLFNRRRIPDLLLAFALVAERHGSARLAIAGENRTHPREDPEALAAEHGIADRVALVPDAADADLARLYARARVFAFLSEYEGFGFTPLEALAAGVPVVAADTPASRETCGEAAWYVPVGDVQAAAHAIERLLVDEASRRRILDAAAAVLGRYDWSEAAARTLGIIEDAASGR
jgi:glycosyltransferase involved in cell wall biosynthesis